MDEMFSGIIMNVGCNILTNILVAKSSPSVRDELASSIYETMRLIPEEYKDSNLVVNYSWDDISEIVVNKISNPETDNSIGEVLTLTLNELEYKGSISDVVIQFHNIFREQVAYKQKLYNLLTTIKFDDFTSSLNNMNTQISYIKSKVDNLSNKSMNNKVDNEYIVSKKKNDSLSFDVISNRLKSSLSFTYAMVRKDKEFLEIFDTPILLDYLIGYMQKENVYYIKNKGEFLSIIIERFLLADNPNYFLGRNKIRELKKILGHLAHCFYNKATIPRDKALEVIEMYIPDYDSVAVYQYLLSTDIIQEVSHNRVDFKFLMIKDFFASTYVLKQFQKEDVKPLEQYLSSSSNHRVISFLSSLFDDLDEQEKFLGIIFNTDLSLFVDSVSSKNSFSYEMLKSDREQLIFNFLSCFFETRESIIDFYFKPLYTHIYSNIKPDINFDKEKVCISGYLDSEKNIFYYSFIIVSSDSPNIIISQSDVHTVFKNSDCNANMRIMRLNNRLTVDGAKKLAIDSVKDDLLELTTNRNLIPTVRLIEEQVFMALKSLNKDRELQTKTQLLSWVETEIGDFAKRKVVKEGVYLNSLYEKILQLPKEILDVPLDSNKLEYAPYNTSMTKEEIILHLTDFYTVISQETYDFFHKNLSKDIMEHTLSLQFLILINWNNYPQSPLKDVIVHIMEIGGNVDLNSPLLVTSDEEAFYQLTKQLNNAFETDYAFNLDGNRYHIKSWKETNIRFLYPKKIINTTSTLYNKRGTYEGIIEAYVYNKFEKLIKKVFC